MPNDTNFCDEIKTREPQEVRDAHKEVESLIQQREILQRKIPEVEAFIERKRRHITELESVAGKALTEGQNSYEKYRVSIRKNVTELESSELELSGLTKALEEVREKFTLAYRRLCDSIKAHLRGCRSLGQTPIDEHMRGVFEARDSYEDALARYCATYGVSYPRTPDILPGIKCDRRLNLELPGGIVSLSAEERT